jgi:acetylglutamate kinase
MDSFSLLRLSQQCLPPLSSLLTQVRGKRVVIKLGGSALDAQRPVVATCLWLQAAGVSPVLVHGGGSVVNAWLAKLSLPAIFRQGMRVTDAPTLDIVKMVLRGLINQELVALAAHLGGQAVGLSGLDGGLLRAHQADPMLGFVGDIEAVNPEIVHTLLAQGYLPIIAPLGQSPDGICLNLNADLVAGHLARALHADLLIFLTDVEGITRPDGSLIAELSAREARQLLDEGVISGGMIPKVLASLQALTTVPRVCITSGDAPQVIMSQMLGEQGSGTRITCEDSSPLSDNTIVREEKGERDAQSVH